MMPGFDGQAVCAALEADPTVTSIPIVLMSAKGEEIGRRFRHMSNVVDAIAKPFTPDALLTVVGHSLDRDGGNVRPEVTETDVGSLSLVPQGQPVAAPGSDAEAAAAAGLSGNLAIISIADVFSLLQDEAQTGIVFVACEDARLQVCFRQGRIDFATAEGVPADFLLGRFLVKAGALTKEALAGALEARPADRGLLGAELVAAGLVGPEEVKRAVMLQTSALVFESLRWGAGRFWFEAGARFSEAAEDAALGLGIDALLMEGFRRVDEWRLIEREIGDFDLVFVRDEDKLVAFGRGRLTREEVLVLELVNGKNSVREIIQLSQLGSFDATKMLYRLLRTKLVRRRVTPVAVA
jgi:CheY-like chemotaxis protein